ncbi:HAD-IA family hydrolase [Aestuariibacter sp. AA17]|uniref:HAD-IA family hydrolase n=1 Tax=Fluctibacter corallii TaxID=2984329 RepID=A0ABT3AC34_9ALTE|nr:HAD-IA family hydrolase [Aestuariibacter sp. AA17]MCV2886234.1 HAD-IA family hydrolase [Aestuariibacter sp. AA17]
MIFYRQIPNVKAITFDLDDTLYDNYPIMRRAEKHLHQFLAERFPNTANMSMHDWGKIKSEFLHQTPSLHNDMGELRKRVLKQGLIQSGYSHMTDLDRHVNDAFEHFYFHRSDFKVSESIMSVLAYLSSRVPLIAITNGNVRLHQIGIASYFIQSFHASLQQPMKPHQHMFDLARTQLSVDAKHILHVGDNLEKDVMGAKQAGFSTAWYAENRSMHLASEKATLLPDIQLTTLEDLKQLV